MRRTKFNGSLILVWLCNLLLNLHWSIPAWILLATHFWLGWPIWLFWVAVVLWILLTVFFTFFIRMANKCSNIPTPKRENKNPYSATNEDLFPTKESLAKEKDNQ